ncbi:putative bifunctional diguanylate cyclase/phosphodiesterase [Acidithiobacillus caldus]|uniref:putative bifunctional diguanylate cyclase/phosphodiesterase n=1 Tax=Acidithiobacillus caldus TaxID=33059 RepID=UPI000A7A7C36|nr:EAL domain-containing protein [Acidithiobacillus caldus]
MRKGVSLSHSRARSESSRYHAYGPRWLRRLWLGIMVVVLIAWVLLAWSDWQQTRAREITGLRTLAAAVAKGTQEMMGGTRVSLTLLGRQLDSDHSNLGPDAGKMLRAYLALQPDMAAVGIRMPSGQVLVSGGSRRFLTEFLSGLDDPANARRLGLNAVQRSALVRCLHSPGFCLGPPVRDLFAGNGQDAWMIPVFQPVQGARDRQTLLALLPLRDGRLPSWRGLPMPSWMSIFLLRDDGFLESRFPPPTRATYAVRQDGIAARYVFAHPERPSGVYYGLSTAVGQRRLGAVQRVTGYPLVAGVSIPRSVLWADWWDSFEAPTAGALALLLLSTFGYGYLRRLGREREGERQRAEQTLWEAKERAEVTLHSIGDAVITTDTQGRVTDMNVVAEALLGYARSEVLGTALEDVFHIVQEGTHTPVANPVRRVLEEGKVVGLANHTVLITKDGEERAIEDSAAPIRDRRGALLGVVLVFHDVTEKRRLTAELAHQATHDALTGLPNRTLFLDRLAHDRAQATRHERQLAVGILDLDGFKLVNDRFGHAAGDALLQEMAQRLQTKMRSGDTLARMGGDEFGLLLTDITQIDEVEHACARMLEALRTPFHLPGGEEVPLSASIGLTSYPLDDSSPADLLRHADLALYAAKAAGRDCFRWFDWPMDKRQEEAMEVRKMLENALDRGHLLLHYQPVVEIDNGPIGVEALLRLDHPERGLLSPAAFASALDAPRLARRIGCFVLASAFAQAQTWHRQGLPLRVSVNIGAHHLLDQRFLADLQAALDAHPDLPPSSVEIEITETAPLLDFAVAQDTLAACNRLGVRIALDDFGTGNASLTYLQKLPAQTIKIDQSFVRDIINDPKDYAIVTGVVASARLLGLEVIAEGVETTEHAVLLSHLRCHCLQGYAIARPMAPEAIPDWIY